MRILILNQDWFAKDFREAGHEVLTASMFPGLERQYHVPLLHIDSLLSNVCAGFSPDCIVWHDNSAPVAVQGLEDCDIPCIFYSVDTQHHIDIHRNAAHIFDLTFAAQKDYLDQFEALGTSAIWLPLWASRHIESSDEKSFGACFVGNLNPKLNPARVAFFEKLNSIYPIHMGYGEFWKIFPKAEVVLNQTVKGDLNFRTFEAMMSGAVLLTERTGNGLFDLFREGEHLVTYEKDDAEGCVTKIKELLSDIPRTRQIGRSGREEILRAHTERHRAEKMLLHIKDLKRTPAQYRYLGAMVNYSVFSQSLARQSQVLEMKAATAALNAAEVGLKNGEVPTQFQSFHLIIAAHKYNRLGATNSGTHVLCKFAEAFPDNQPLTCAKIRQLLNEGRISEARLLAKLYSQHPEEKVFELANQAVMDILATANIEE